MIAKLTLSAAALAVSLIAAPAFAQQPPAAAAAKAPQINPSAYNAIDNIRNQYLAARDNYIKVQQAEIAARNNLDRATASYLSVLSATVQKPSVPPMPIVNVQPPVPVGQPVPPQGQPPAAPRP